MVFCTNESPWRLSFPPFSSPEDEPPAEIPEEEEEGWEDDEDKEAVPA